MSKNRQRHHSSFRGRLLQAIQPHQIRIVPYPISYDVADIQERLRTAIEQKSSKAEIEKLLKEQNQAVNQYKEVFQKQMNLLANVCTGLWRIRQNFSQIPEGEMPDKVRRSKRHLEAIMDSLSQAGFLINDHLRETYDTGMLLKVAAYEPTEGIQRDTVIETIKPSVYWEDETIQVGEVIVGTPVTNKNQQDSPKE